MKRIGKEPCEGTIVAGEEELEKCSREVQSKPSDGWIFDALWMGLALEQYGLRGLFCRELSSLRAGRKGRPSQGEVVC